MASNKINIKLAIKSLPFHITMGTLNRVDLLDFTNVQKSLIAFMNDD